MNTFISVLLNFIITVVIAFPLNFGAASDDYVPVDKAAENFFNGIAACDLDETALYLDNDYIQYLVNSSGDKEVIDRRNEALFENFTFKVEDTAQKGNLAVARVQLSNSNFSKVSRGYDAASKAYIMDNLYSDEIEDKAALSAKCLDIYVSQIEKAADKGPGKEFEIFLVMHRNPDGGWVMEVDDALMSSILGKLQLPETGDK